MKTTKRHQVISNLKARRHLRAVLNECMKPENNIIEGTNMTLDDFMLKLALKQ